jgi:hypothetical protein
MSEMLRIPVFYGSYRHNRAGTITVAQIGAAFDVDGRPTGDNGAAADRAFPRFAADLEWWADAIKRQRAERPPPY